MTASTDTRHSAMENAAASTKEPLVSIVIPCYNHAQFLREAVDSALAQTYKNIEIIVVNDGSTDERSRTILASFSAPKCRIVHQENRGLAGARNTGIAEARGRYILPLDADDRIEPGYLAAAVPLLEEDSALGIVTCRARYFGFSDKEWRLPECTLENMLRENCIHACSLFRKSDWEAVGGFDERLRPIYEDYDFWLSLLGLGKKARRLDAVMLHYRRHDASDTMRLRKGDLTLHLDVKRKVLAHIFVRHIDLYRQHPDLSARCIYTVLRLPRPKFMEFKKAKYQCERALLQFLSALPLLRPVCAKRTARLDRKLDYIATVEQQEQRL